MKPTLVTGASGFLGWHVARLAGRARAARSGAGPAGQPGRELDVEPVPAICATRVARTRREPAAAWSFTWPPITGSGRADPANCTTPTSTARATCWKRPAAGVDRVVYTSTVGCIGVPPGGEGDEDHPVSLDGHEGRLQALQVPGRASGAGVRGGLPVVIVNPTAPMGDHDIKPTPPADRPGFPARRHAGFIDTGLNVVDARDVALGHLAGVRARPAGRALHSGIGKPDAGADPGETGRHHGPSGAHRAVCRTPGLVRGRVQHRVGAGHRKAAAGAARRGPHGAQEDVGFARQGRARTGLRSRVPRKALRRAVEWFRANGYAVSRRRAPRVRRAPGFVPAVRSWRGRSIGRDGRRGRARSAAGGEWRGRGAWAAARWRAGSGFQPERSSAWDSAARWIRRWKWPRWSWPRQWMPGPPVRRAPAGRVPAPALQPACVASIDHVAQTAAEKRACGYRGIRRGNGGGGVAQFAAAHGHPPFCVRSVTDLAGREHGQRFQCKALRPTAISIQ
jgi:dihydroflavonol-4-reductase